MKGKRGHSSFLLLFTGFPTGFHGNTGLCQEPHELPEFMLQPRGCPRTEAKK